MRPAPMDETQIRAVLAVAMSYDHRDPGDSDVEAWLAAAHLGNWTYAEARDAVIAHFTFETEYLKPAHVTQRIKAARRTAPMPAERQLPAAPPAEPERVRAAVAEIAARLGWPERTTTANDPELAHVCPHERCRAGKNRPCGYRITRGAHAGEWRPIRGYHPSRTEAAQQKEATRA